MANEEAQSGNQEMNAASAEGSNNTELYDICVVDSVGENGQMISTISRPGAGQELEVKMFPGQTYQFDFPEEDVDTFSQQEDGSLVLSFADGSEIVLLGFAEASNADIPALVAFSEVIVEDETVVVLEEAPEDGLDDPQSETRDEQPQEQAQAEEIIEEIVMIEPAAGDEPTAQQVAQIEPAAGETGGGAPTNSGYGFNSARQATPLVSPDAIGPLGETALQYGITFQPGIVLPQAALAPLDPDITAGDQIFVEDTTGPINLDIDASRPTTQMEITITGIPTNWAVDPNGGTYDSVTGTWTFTTSTGADFSGGPILTPPHDSDVDEPGLTLTVVETDAVTNERVTETTTFDLIVDAEADAPNIDADDSEDFINQVQDVDITTSLNDTDGSETIDRIVIEGMPSGFTLNHGTRDPATGHWTIDPADLADLEITPPNDYEGTIDLVAVSYSVESNPTDIEPDLTNNEASARDPFSVTWKPIDPPTIVVNNGNDDVQVKEDGTVDVPLVAQLSTTGSAAEFLTITVSGIDPSWGFSAPIGNYDSSTGTWSYVAPADTDVSTTLTFAPPAQSDVDLSGLTATAVATDPNLQLTANDTDDFNIIVDAVADVPNINGSDDAGLVNAVLDVDFSGSLGADRDGSESIVKYVVSGVPSGFTLTDNGAALSPVSAGTYEFAPGADLSNLQLVSPTGYLGNVDLDVTIHTQDTPTDGEFDNSDNTNSATDTITLSWIDDPTVDVKTGAGASVNNAQVKEDGSVSLVVEGKFGAAHTVTSVLTTTVTGIDSSWGFNPSIGSYNSATGTWTYTAPANTEISAVLRFTPPAQSDIDLSGLKAETTLSDSVNGLNASSGDHDFNIIVDAVADKPDVQADGGSVHEGNAIAIDISGQLGADRDGSEHITGYNIYGVPAGAAFNKGTDLGGGVWTFSPSEINGLVLSPPNASHVGTYTLTAQVVTADRPSDGEFDASDNTNFDNDVFTVQWREDTSPTVTHTTNTVDETGGFDTVHGTVPVNYYNDGFGGVQTNGWFQSSTGLQTCGGAPVTVSVDGNGNYVGTANGQPVFAFLLNNQGGYTFQQYANLKHPDTHNSNEVIQLHFGVRARDADGDTGDSHVTINVHDDGPRAADENLTVHGDTGAINVLANDDAGGDGGLALVRFQVNGVAHGAVGPGGTIATPMGNVRIDANGTLSLDRPDATESVSTSVRGYMAWRNGQNGMVVEKTTTTTHTVPGGNLDVLYTVRDCDGDEDMATAHLDVREIKNTSTTVTETFTPNRWGGDGDGGGDGTPLAFDLDGDGVELTTAQDGVQFDIDVDGDLEQTAWVEADDALLALDRNGDGMITDRSELFGDTDGFADGFENLASYDSNGDGQIDAQDAIWGDLRLWQDVNQDGVSDADELLTLDQIGIASISLTSMQPDDMHLSGNWISHTGTYTTVDGEEREIVDAWFSFAENEMTHLVDGDLSTEIYASDFADTFRIENVSDEVVTIEGFSAEEGDRIDVSQVLEQTDDVTAAINDFVYARSDGDDTIISIDMDGTGAGQAQDLVRLSDVSAEDLQNMFNADNSTAV